MAGDPKAFPSGEGAERSEADEVSPAGSQSLVRIAFLLRNSILVEAKGEPLKRFPFSRWVA